MVMNHKIRIGQPARYIRLGIVLLGQTTFPLLIILWWQKNEKRWSGHVRLLARVAKEEGLLNVRVSQSFV